MTRQVLALHPSLGHGGAFGPLGAALSGLGANVDITAPDLIGHGAAPPWDGRSDLHSAVTRAVIALAEDMAQRGPLDVIGHSFGATLALRIALERGELLRSMVLIEPVLFAAARADEAAEYKDYAAEHARFDAAMLRGDSADAARHFLAQWGDAARPFDSLPRATQDYITARLGLVQAQTGALVGDSAGIMGYMRLESCPIPTLIVQGGKSPPVMGAICRALAARLPQVQGAVVARAGHMLPLTHAGAVAGHIAAFWQGLPR